MKTIHVKTKRVIAHKRNGEPVYETIVQKLEDLNPFKSFISLVVANGYADATVVGVYNPKTREVSKDPKEIKEYQDRIDIALNPSKEPVIDYKSKAESLEERLKNLEELFSAKNKSTDSDEDYKQELKDRVKELGGSTRGLSSTESLEQRVSELEAQ